MHAFLAGAMADLNTAGFEPMFMMIHAFFDLIFENFRQTLPRDEREYFTLKGMQFLINK